MQLQTYTNLSGSVLTNAAIAFRIVHHDHQAAAASNLLTVYCWQRVNMDTPVQHYAVSVPYKLNSAVYD